jgi:hypothetical protein
VALIGALATLAVMGVAVVGMGPTGAVAASAGAIR